MSKDKEVSVTNLDEIVTTNPETLKEADKIMKEQIKTKLTKKTKSKPKLVSKKKSNKRLLSEISIGDKLYLTSNPKNLSVDGLATELNLEVKDVKKLLEKLAPQPTKSVTIIKSAITKSAGGRSVAIMTESLSQMADENKTVPKVDLSCTVPIKKSNKLT